MRFSEAEMFCSNKGTTLAKWDSDNKFADVADIVRLSKGLRRGKLASETCGD